MPHPATPSSPRRHVAVGAQKPLLPCGPKRIARLPGVATVAESFPGFGFWSWYGFAAPAPTPDAIVHLLRKEFGAVIDAEVALRKRLVDELAQPRI